MRTFTICIIIGILGFFNFNTAFPEQMEFQPLSIEQIPKEVFSLVQTPSVMVYKCLNCFDFDLFLITSKDI